MNEGETLRTAVVVVPGRAWAAVTDLAAQNLSEKPDPRRSASQHRALIRTLERAGVRVAAVEEPPGLPNATFPRDVALVTGSGYVRLRMGLPARSGEPAWMARALERLGVPRLGAIEPSATVEGGDVLLAGDVALVGRSRRTDRDGIARLAALLEPQGLEVRVAPVPRPHLHLGGVASLVAPRRVVVEAGALDRGFLRGFDVIEVPRRGDGPSGANVLCLGPDRVVADPGDGPEAVEILESAGVWVQRLDLSEFRKANGGPTCLVLPIERG